MQVTNILHVLIYIILNKFFLINQNLLDIMITFTYCCIITCLFLCVAINDIYDDIKNHNKLI